jgi:hypothetical protein
VSAEDYEVIVVENDSDAEYGEERARAHGENVRYFRREERGVSPVAAVNFGFEQARAPFIGFMIDGAHMVTPRVVEHALRAARLHPRPIVAVPAHHIGQVEQHLAKTAGYDERVEERLLAESKWKDDGYVLFDIGVWSGANSSGFMCPSMESNALFCTREMFDAIGRADARFDGPGGGLVNQDVYLALCRLPNSRLIVLASEGSFHQYHGGVSTSEIPGRDEMLAKIREEHVSIRGREVIGHDREPILLGTFPRQGLRYVKKSAQLGRLRHHMCITEGRLEWPYD